MIKNKQITITVKKENGQLILSITDDCSWTKEYQVLNPFKITCVLPTRADSVYERLFIEIIKEEELFFINASYKGNSFKNIPLYEGLRMELS